MLTQKHGERGMDDRRYDEDVREHDLILLPCSLGGAYYHRVYAAVGGDGHLRGKICCHFYPLLVVEVHQYCYLQLQRTL